jgi:hypothetical protein
MQDIYEGHTMQDIYEGHTNTPIKSKDQSEPTTTGHKVK